MSSLKIFPGELVAREKEVNLKKDVLSLKSLRVTPNLTTILIGSDRASKLFISLKKKAAKRIGAEINVRTLRPDVSVEKVINLIKKLNNDSKVHGIMIQLPISEKLRKDTTKIINYIDPKKDVDGMRDDSEFITPTVKAVLTVIKEASKDISEPLLEVVVVGAKGFIGKKMIKTLVDMDYKVTGLDLETKALLEKTKNADILISATGKQGLIKKGMVKKGAVVIDVGAPYGDIDFREVVTKASLITPVPGGIGPVTISSLLENLVEAAKSSLQ